MNENKSILIHFDDEHEPEETIREVQRLVEEGYTSGIDPNWEMVTEDKEEKSASPMKAIDELIELSIEHCAECNCAVGDDWQYKDFSNKMIVVCPQCGEETYTDGYKVKL